MRKVLLDTGPLVAFDLEAEAGLGADGLALGIHVLVTGEWQWW